VKGIIFACVRNAGRSQNLRRARPQKFTAELAAEAQLLITMGCGDECPYVPGVRRDDWPLDDPQGQPVERVRAIRDEIRTRVEALVAQEAARHDSLHSGWRIVSFLD
jgi:protein-tyrosine-phosphatase